MKTKIFAVVLLAAIASVPGAASAKGCLKGAAVGGVGGHFAGHHGLLGAAAGCAIGRHQANKHARTDAVRANQSVPVNAANSTRTYTPTR